MVESQLLKPSEAFPSIAPGAILPCLPQKDPFSRGDTDQPMVLCSWSLCWAGRGVCPSQHGWCILLSLVFQCLHLHASGICSSRGLLYLPSLCCSHHTALSDAPHQQALAVTSKLLSQNLEIAIQQAFLDMPARPSDKSASKNHENCCSLLQGKFSAFCAVSGT